MTARHTPLALPLRPRSTAVLLLGSLAGLAMFVWPLLGTLMVVIGTVVGTHLAEAAGGL